ncbi:hypothetical protein CVIRNUC_002819 [Coccomyxa viridis]|uniref:Transmembrane protein 192 n=1 Tax=Coccomyxa viridis TaxID=1274662 RepID=A0AAV1I0I5_9CHLO|nr:hypothetical protein CVIRNUC_002819 [Coccomyxa viridis]
MPNESQQERRSRTGLSDYDETLLLDRTHIPVPEDPGDFGAGEQPEAELGTGTGPILGTAAATLCYWACACTYTVFLFITIYTTRLDDFEVKASAHILLLLLALLLESYLRLQHRRRQAAGYLAFYWRTRSLLPLATRVTALGQGLLTMVAFWADVPPQPDQLCKLQIIACLELAAITLFTILYLAQLWRHFREVQPDAERYLAAAWLPVPGCDHSRGPDTVVEQQAEAMRWLSRRCHDLQLEVLRLTVVRERHEQHRGRAAGSSRADAEHRLVARERELRALAAEKDVLAQQARAAWALLDERSAAAHELEAVKQQQLDENNRLRATLEEWSHRNARLEAKLNRTRARLEESQQQQRRPSRGSTPELPAGTDQSSQSQASS